ncbi:zinc ribbon-containing protein [Dickeya lacustris]|uniref:Zinc ribbon-containing protein n=1 Tax=Dickeya lacustris TaxID=2259638 RepID=A0ABY8G681_9GAMM|nr:zinc ribbon-containing protein [Dickeya lacustris]WFN55425.1 zinc ribbon-containing protein [Dickeya lacustris]
MNKVIQYYRELLSAVTEWLGRGERDIDRLMLQARQYLQETQALTQKEIELVMVALERDLAAFSISYTHNQHTFTDSVFMRVIRESLWQNLADITDKTQLEWREVFKDVSHHGVYHSGEVVGLGNLVCEQCFHHVTFYTPEVLPHCPKCGHDQFHRQPFSP